MSKVIFTLLIVCIVADGLVATDNPDDGYHPASFSEAFVELSVQNTSGLIHKNKSGYSGEKRDGKTPGTDHPLSSHHICPNETELPEEEIFFEQDFQIAGTSDQNLRLPDNYRALKPVYATFFYDMMLISLTTIVLLH